MQGQFLSFSSILSSVLLLLKSYTPLRPRGEPSPRRPLSIRAGFSKVDQTIMAALAGGVKFADGHTRWYVRRYGGDGAEDFRGDFSGCEHGGVRAVLQRCSEHGDYLRRRR